MNDLLYSVGLDITDLKTSARAAKEQADDVKKSLKGFKDVLEFGGVGAAVYGFFRSVVNYAQELKGPLDENTAAVRRFGNSIDQAKEGTLSWGAQLLGFFNRAGEGWGLLLRSMVDGRAVVTKGLEVERDAEKAIAEIQEQKKKNGEALKKINEDMASLDKERTKLALDGLTTQEKLNLAVTKVLEARTAEAASVGDTLEKRKLQLATQQAEVDYMKAYAAVDRETAAAKKKADDDQEKAAEKHIALQDKLLKLRFEALKDEEKLRILLDSQGALQSNIAALKKEGIDTTQQEIDLLEVTADLEKLRTEEMEKQKRIKEETIEEEAEAAQQAAAWAEIERKGIPIIGTAVRNGQDFANSNDEALEELVYRNRRDATNLRNDNPMNYYNIRLEAGRLEQEANNAQAELRLRQGIRQAYATGGSAQVYQSYRSLDPLVLDRLIQQFALQQTNDEKTLGKISSIEERLAKLFR